MTIRGHFIRLHALDWVAIFFALLLSFACLARGAVDDACVAWLLLAALPMLWVAWRDTGSINRELRQLGMVLAGGFALVLLVQYINAAWGAKPFDIAAWIQAIGPLLFSVITASIALSIGSHESSARLFLITLLISGAACLALTFFLARSDMMTASIPQPYRHGFVNANNAATYLGLMLLLSIAQMGRFAPRSTKSTVKILLDFIDTLNLSIITKGGILLFSLLISLLGLLMTASRGGILISLLCSAGLIFLLLLKSKLRSITRIVSIGFCSMVLIWVLTAYGQNLSLKLQTNGVNTNSRLEIMAAVIPMIADRPWLGNGLGSFAGAFQPYRPATISSDGILDKAHNSYLEFAAEMGLPLLLLLLMIVGRIGIILLRGVLRRTERYTIPSLGLASWLLVAVHSLVDFPMQIPGLAAVFVAVIVVCACQADPRAALPSPPRKRIRIRKRQHANRT
jgi:O-antigen ligase